MGSFNLILLVLLVEFQPITHLLYLLLTLELLLTSDVFSIFQSFINSFFMYYPIFFLSIFSSTHSSTHEGQHVVFVFPRLSHLT